MPAPEDNTESESAFLADNEHMDLSNIKDKSFVVAVGTGDPNGVKFLCSTVHGPYNFIDMVQEVGDMWQKNQHHAKAIILDKAAESKVLVLDGDTIEYIECHYNNILMEEALGGGFDETKPYTCKAKTISEAKTEKKL